MWPKRRGATRLQHTTDSCRVNIILASTLAAVAALAATLLMIHSGFRAPRRREQGNPADVGLEYREIDIPTTGGKRLFAWWIPADSSAPTIILLHGWGGNAEMMLPLALPLHDAGMNVLLLDARNHGRSDSASFSSLPRFAEDVGAATDWVKMQHKNRSDYIALLGHSVGAGAVLLEASRRRDIAAVISISAFAHPEWMMRRYLTRHKVPKLFAKNCSTHSLELLLIEGAGHDSVDKVEEHGDQLVTFLRQAGFSN